MTARPSAPKTEDYSFVADSLGPRRDFRITVGLREGWDAEGRVFDVSEAVRTARAWMKRRTEAGQPASFSMFTRAEVTMRDLARMALSAPNANRSRFSPAKLFTLIWDICPMRQSRRC